MTLASAFLELDHAASRLEERFGHLHWAVASSEQSDPPTVVHQWHDLSTDFSDLARELAATARLGRLAVNGRSGLQGAHGALARCQECYGTLWLRYCADGLSPGGRRGLDSLRRRGDPLTDWARGVADANDRSPPRGTQAAGLRPPHPDGRRRLPTEKVARFEEAESSSREWVTLIGGPTNRLHQANLNLVLISIWTLL